MSSRWVLTWKEKDGEWIVKARLVFRGFLDPQVNQLYTASATASAASHRQLCSKGVNEKWQIISIDISTAFIQGITFKDLNSKSYEGRRLTAVHREVYFDFPPGPVE